MRGLVRFLVLLIVVVAIVYLGAWWYIQGRMAMAFRAQEQHWRAAGWTMSHGSTQRGRSPLAATYTVDDLKLTPPNQGLQTPRVMLPQMVMAIHPTAPFTLDLGLPLEWHVMLQEGPAFTLHFTRIAARERFSSSALLNHDTNPARATHIAFAGMRLDSANTNFTLLSIASFNLDAWNHPNAGKSATAFRNHVTLAGLALSPIFVTIGHLPFAGKLASLNETLTLSGPNPTLPPPTMPKGLVMDPAQAWQIAGPVIHQWVQAGGHGTFTIGLGLGPLIAHTHGQIGFDAKSQPMASAVLTAAGFGEFLGDVANAYPAMVGMVSALTAQTAPYVTRTAGKQRLIIHFTLANRTLSANGKPVGTVPAINWPAKP